MATVPLQTLEELDISAEEFETLVMAGLNAAVIEVMNTEDIDRALRNADPAALDAIVAFWATYVSTELLPSIDANMLDAGMNVIAGLAEAVGNPLALLVDQALDTELYLQQARNRLVAIGDELWANARAELAEGTTLGESVPKLTARVRAAIGVTEPRARMIARTEVHGARNTVAMGTMLSFEALYGVPTGVINKQWQAALDERTRPTHVVADNQIVAMNAPFMVGNAELAFPGDPSGPAAEVINCRCATFAVFDPKELNLSDNGTVVTLTAAARREGFSDMPVAPADRDWDGDAAAERLASQCGVNEEDANAEAWNCYAGGFLYRDDEADAATKSAYKLGVVDVIDGRKTLVPRAVFAVAGVLQGARGGADIPSDQQDEIKSITAGLYDRINEALDTDYTAPWDSEASSVTAAATPLRNTAPWSGVIVVEGAPAYDGQEYAPGALEWPELGETASLEIPLGWKYERAHGGVDNGNTVDVGRVDSIERIGNEIHARGVLDLDSQWGREAARQMGTRGDPGFLAGISIIDDNGPRGEVEYVLPEGCEELPEDATGEDVARCMTPERIIYHSGRIRSADLVSIPAFVEARVYLDDEAEIPEVDDVDEPDSEALTAAAYTLVIPDLPPAEWFEEPKEVPEIGAITITDDGRFFGYLAPKQIAHRGYRDKRVTVPTGNVDYGIWMNRATMVDDGRGGYAKIATGPITMDCGHASMGPKGAARREHYDNACSVVATARVGENARGVWISGALIPGVDANQVARMMACQLSGDWGPHREKPGKRELAAALLVPVPGFPTRSRSFTLRGGELARTVTPVRFGTRAGVDEPIGIRAAVDRIAAQVGLDRESKMREFATELRKVLKGDE
jgi:hypothetical protein